MTWCLLVPFDNPEVDARKRTRLYSFICAEPEVRGSRRFRWLPAGRKFFHFLQVAYGHLGGVLLAGRPVGLFMGDHLWQVLPPKELGGG